jgi:cysteine sulfinate desulfinase/cysteine desulfurase-like protein
LSRLDAHRSAGYEGDAGVVATQCRQPLFYSGEHAFGSRAADAIHQARSQIASLLGADRGEIFFTSSGAEANNLAILGGCGQPVEHPIQGMDCLPRS